MSRMCMGISAVAMTLALGIETISRADDASKGFTRLFNGKDLAGWTTYLDPKFKEADPKKVWTIEDGVIKCTGTPNGYLLTDKEFGDYVLRVQWRFAGKPGNSGVFVHCSGPDKIWPKGVEAQLMSGRAGDFWLVDGFKMDVPQSEGRQDPNSSRHFLRTGDSFKKTGGKDSRGRDKYEVVSQSIEKPLGEWNQYEITCKGNKIDLAVNGHHVNTGTNCEATKGKILLQSEGAPIEFRNIEIKPIK